MANEKITDMTAIVTYADADLIEVVDVSEPSAEDQNKKMTKQVLFDSTPDFGNGFTLAGGSNLSNYEEGTWTPAVTFGGGSTGLTYTIQAGAYTKIGDIVWCSCHITLSAKGSSAGLARITGLPFTVPNTSVGNVAATLRPQTVSFADVFVQYALQNTTEIRLEEVTAAGTITPLTEANFNNTSELILQITYKV